MPIKFPKEKLQERRIKVVRRKEEEKAAKKTAERFGLPYTSLVFKSINSSALQLVSEDEAREANLAVINKKGGAITVIITDPENRHAKELLEYLKKQFEDVSVFVASYQSVEKAWTGYTQKAKDKKQISGEVDVSPGTLEEFKENINSTKDLKEAIDELSSQKNISLIVELILAGALSLDASDVHIEPEDKKIRLRFRIDGLMRDVATIDAHLYKLLLSRIKLLSSMKLNIHNTAQDGRFSVSFESFEPQRQTGIGTPTEASELQIRSSVLPGEFGENIVLRVLNPSSLLSLEQLGIRKELLDIVDTQIKKPNGMILTTGPTGSGKTTTLYAFLKKLQTPEVKIITVEDPIEYHLEGISQTQADPEKGYTFVEGLRSILRQDPDIILIGEIRDRETVETTLQASLTGHLVLSTLHTNDAAGVVPRLVDLGASTSTIGPALSMAIAQRVVRRLCEECKITKKASESELKILSRELEALRIGISPDLEISEAKGCDKCAQEGYKGRVGIYEILVNTPEFEKFILANPTITEIREYLISNKVATLKQDGFLKVIDGITTIGEVERIVGE